MPASTNRSNLIRSISVAVLLQLIGVGLAWQFLSEVFQSRQNLRAAIYLDRKIFSSAVIDSRLPYADDKDVLRKRMREIIARADVDQLDSEKLERLVEVSADAGAKLQRASQSTASSENLGAVVSNYLSESRNFVSLEDPPPEWLMLLSIAFSFSAVLLLVLNTVASSKNSMSLPVPTAAPPAGPATAALDHLAGSITGTLTMGAKSAKSYLDNMPLGLITVDSNGSVRAANLTALKLLRCTVDSIADKNIGSFIKLADRRYTADLDSLKEAALNQITEAKLIPSEPSANPVPVDISLAEFSGPAGSGFILNVLDITDRHEVEKLKEDFLAIVSHDLKTPLSSIGLFLSDLRSLEPNQALSPEQRVVAVAMEAEVERLIRLVVALLDMARIRSGRLLLTKKSVPLPRLLEQLQQGTAKLAQRKSVSVTVKAPDDFVIVDEDRIYQVLDNLVGNAIKFSNPGEVVSVEALTVPSGIRIEVRDTGPGIPIEKCEQIFERYQQVSIEDSTVRGGTGLGLAICKLIIEQHGGSIGVESEPGKGSCFWFLIPD
ncbi:MAG: HAMP domain-containing histidine kinase [Candidatus Obscuribacterales bacterium]|nr:HAMP domain-containing histidine kinase [Candidatus Obscuribacterales bacterium]